MELKDIVNDDVAVFGCFQNPLHGVERPSFAVRTPLTCLTWNPLHGVESLEADMLGGGDTILIKNPLHGVERPIPCRR